MSDQKPLREELEARIISQISGELSPEDSQELDALIAHSDELLAFREHMRTLIGEIAEEEAFFAPEKSADTPTRLSKDRRAAVNAQIEAAQPATRKERRVRLHSPIQASEWNARRIFAYAAGFTLIFGVLAAILIPSVGKVQSKSQRSVESDIYIHAEPELSMPRYSASKPQEQLISESVVMPKSEAANQFKNYNKLFEEADQTSMSQPVIVTTYVSNLGLNKLNIDVPVIEQRVSLGAGGNGDTANIYIADEASKSNYGDVPSGDKSSNGLAVFPRQRKKPNTFLGAKQLEPNQSSGVQNSLGFEYESEYAFRGGNTSDQNFTPSAAISVVELHNTSDSVDHLMSSDNAKVEEKKAEMSANVTFFGLADSPRKERESTEIDYYTSSAGETITRLAEKNDAYAYKFSQSSIDPFAPPRPVSAPKPTASSGPASRSSQISADNIEVFQGNLEEIGFGNSQGLSSPADPFAAPAATTSSSGDPFATSIGATSGPSVSNQERSKLNRDEKLKDLRVMWQSSGTYDRQVVESNPLKKIKIPRVSFSGVPLSQVLQSLSEQSVSYDMDNDEKSFIGCKIVFNESSGEDPLVHITLRQLSMDRILDFTTESVGFMWEQKDGVIIVSKAVPTAPATQQPLPEVLAADDPFSTFSLNVSDVSFRLAESALNANTLPIASEIRAEEFVNALPPEMPTTAVDQDVRFDWELSDFPMDHGRQLLRFAVQAASTGRLPSQAANLVLVVDCSGSMQRPDRQEILHDSLTALAAKLGPQDRLSAVVFARTPRVVADGVSGVAVGDVINRVLTQRPEGGTNLELALQAGYELAQRHLRPGGLNRVVLLTDGAANLGEVDADALRALVVANRQRGIALDAFGIGWDGYNDALLEALTRNSNGRYAFLNSPETAATEFADKLAGALNVSAADVKVQIEWNPDRVISYRQIGYEKHQLKTEDFRNNAVDAAELSAAETGQALYVVQLRPDAIGGLGTLRVRYLDPQSGDYNELAWPLEYPAIIPLLDQSTASHRLAAAGALLADKLAQTPQAGNYTLAEVEALVSTLPPSYQQNNAAQSLRNMIRQARQLLSE